MSNRIKTLCCLLLFALTPLTMGGCPGQDAFTAGVSDGISAGVAAAVEDFLTGGFGDDG